MNELNRKRSVFIDNNDSDKNVDIQKQLIGLTSFVTTFVIVIPYLLYKSNMFGILEGYILEEKQGEFGFGYDPIFFVPEKGKSLASISSEIKNEISHRGLAIDKFKNKINQLSNV